MKQRSDSSTLRRLTWVVLPLSMIAFAAGCSDNGSESAKDKASPSPTNKAVAPVYKLKVNPGSSKGFVEAPRDVSAMKCTQDGAVWKVSGTVENPSKATVDYRIYTYFQTTESARGVLETDVDGVKAGAKEKWNGEMPLKVDDLQCILRVERTPVT